MQTLGMARVCALGSVSLIALSFTAADIAIAQSTLPAVTVDAPKPRQARSTPVRRAATARTTTTRSAPAPLQRTEPVRHVTPSTGTVGAPPAAFAGGQVGSGSQLGLLGNRGIMDTPFNQTSYTSELMANQQARTVADVMANDPSARVVTTSGGGQDAYYIRGFYYGVGQTSLNGLYGIAPYYSVAANFVDRVEVLKGPSALLGGMPPGGAVGGSMNLVTKKAPDYDITQLTTTYASKSQFGTLVDIARRYGEQKEWGIRFNGNYRNGDTAFDRQSEEFGNAVLGLDYRGERIRASVDAGYQAQNLSPAMRFLSVDTGLPVPRAPDAGTNFVVPWAHWRPRDTFVAGRAEVDVTDWATVYGAVGYRESTLDFISVAPTIVNAAGDYGSRPLIGFSSFETTSAETGIRANVDTGPVNHALSVNYSYTNVPNYNDFSVGTNVVSNIYNPRFVPVQGTGTPLYRNLVTTELSSVGVADTMSILDKRVQFTIGARRQTVGQNSINYTTGAATAYEESVWSPGYALVIKPFDRLSLYANHIEGLQPGATVGPGFGNIGQIFPPFQSKQTEVGAKIDYGRMIATFSLFQITQPSLITIPGLPLPRQELSGEQRNRGLEMNVFGELAPDLRLLGGVTLLDGRQTRTQGGLNDGKWALGVAQVNVNLGLEWDTPFVPGFTLTGRVIHTGEQYLDAGNTQILPSWTRVDLGARYTFLSPWNGKPIVIRANVENVANTSYWASAYSGVLTVGAPRTYLLSTTFNF